MPTQPVRAGAVTLLDWAKSIDPQGRPAATAELLTQTNPFLQDIPFIEGNLPTGHRHSIRTGLPVSVWRQMYQGVPPSKSARATVDDACGMLEARSEIDVEVIKLNGNAGAFRLSESRAFLESMNQNMITAFLYNDVAVNPERPQGLAPRYSSTSANNGRNIFLAGGAGSDNTSIWLVCWGAETVHGIFPRGSDAGLEHEDLDVIDAFDASNNRYRAYADHWKWKCGLAVKDWRYAVRIANIDVSDLLARTGTQAPTAATNIIYMMLDALNTIPTMGMGRPVFYASRRVKAALMKMAMDRSQNALAIQPAVAQFGNPAPGRVDADLTFMGVPVRTTDALLETEALVA